MQTEGRITMNLFIFYAEVQLIFAFGAKIMNKS